MEKETSQAAEGLKNLRQEFEAAAAYARGNKGKLLRAWFTGEDAAKDEADYASYARKIQQAQELFASPAGEDRKKARTGLLDLKREFGIVADLNRLLPPPGLGAVIPAVIFTDNPKALRFDGYSNRLDALLTLMRQG
jgi:hypothetical protein